MRGLADELRAALPGEPEVDLRDDHDGIFGYATWADGSYLNLHRYRDCVHYSAIRSRTPGFYKRVCDTQPGFWKQRGVTHFTASIPDDAPAVLFEHAAWQPWLEKGRPGNHIWWL